MHIGHVRSILGLKGNASNVFWGHLQKFMKKVNSSIGNCLTVKCPSIQFWAGRNFDCSNGQWITILIFKICLIQLTVRSWRTVCDFLYLKLSKLGSFIYLFSFKLRRQRLFLQRNIYATVIAQRFIERACLGLYHKFVEVIYCITSFYSNQKFSFPIENMSNLQWTWKASTNSSNVLNANHFHEIFNFLLGAYMHPQMNFKQSADDL